MRCNKLSNSSQIKLYLIVLLHQHHLLPCQTNAFQPFTRKSKRLDEVLGLLFLCNSWIEFIFAYLINFGSEGWKCFNVIVHFINIYQLHIFLIVVVELIITLHQLLGKQQNSNPNRIHLNSHLLSLAWRNLTCLTEF